MIVNAHERFYGLDNKKLFSIFLLILESASALLFSGTLLAIITLIWMILSIICINDANFANKIASSVGGTIKLGWILSLTLVGLPIIFIIKFFFIKPTHVSK